MDRSALRRTGMTFMAALSTVLPRNTRLIFTGVSAPWDPSHLNQLDLVRMRADATFTLNLIKLTPSSFMPKIHYTRFPHNFPYTGKSPTCYGETGETGIVDFGI